MSLASEFHGAMHEIYRLAKTEAGYVASRFLQLVEERGGLEAARYLLHAPQVSEGFTTLWEKKRLDLSVEAYVLRARYQELFTAEELSIARDRLERYGFQPREGSGT